VARGQAAEGEVAGLDHLAAGPSDHVVEHAGFREREVARGAGPVRQDDVDRQRGHGILVPFTAGFELTLVQDDIERQPLAGPARGRADAGRSAAWRPRIVGVAAENPADDGVVGCEHDAWREHEEKEDRNPHARIVL
jgi:hypothetical protein